MKRKPTPHYANLALHVEKLIEQVKSLTTELKSVKAEVRTLRSEVKGRKESAEVNKQAFIEAATKIDADDSSPVAGTVFTVEGIDSDYRSDWTTGEDGTVTNRVAPGTYRITEKSVPAPYYLPDKDADRVQTISLNAGDDKSITFKNRKMPLLTIYKEDSIAGADVEGAKFRSQLTRVDRLERERLDPSLKRVTKADLY